MFWLKIIILVVITWALMCCCYHPTDTLLITGVRSLKAYVDQVIKPILNISSNEYLQKAPHLNNNPIQTVTLKEYLNNLPFNKDDNPTQNIKLKNSTNGSIVFMTRIGDYNQKTVEGGQWIEVTGWGNHGNEEYNSTLSNLNAYEMKEDTNNLKKEKNIEEYENNYQDFLYTFKDLVSIGLNPKVTNHIVNKQYHGKLNATYIMPIPKTTKFFEFKVTNLTQEQYNELNDMVKRHLQMNKQNSTLYSNAENKDTQLAKKDEKRQISNIDLNQSSSSLQTGTQSSAQLNSDGRGIWKNIQADINIPLHQLFTENNYETFKNNIKKNISSKMAGTNKNTENNTKNPSLINNNGFHAEIATDYMPENDEGQRPIPNVSTRYSGPINNTNLKNQFNREWLTNLNDSVITALLMKIIEEKLIKDNQFQNVKQPLVSDKATKDGMSNNTQHPINSTTWKSITHSKSQPQSVENSVTLKNKSQANSYLEGAHLKTINSSITDGNRLNNLPSNVEGQGLNASHMSLSINMTENNYPQKKSNIDKSFIADFFHNNGSYLINGEDDVAKVMKINRQGNILEELKMLMLEYFVSLQLNTNKADNYSSLVEDILNSTNLFELMQRSSKFVKDNLKLKVQNKRKEPSTFVKKIIDTQVDRCKLRYNGFEKTMNGTLKNNMSQSSFKKNSRRRFMSLTKCITSKIRECVIGFNNWLAKGKFYLRPNFKLQRAYEHFEIERNLFCLREYNATFLDSNLHKIRIWPGVKKGMMSGARRVKPGRRRFRMKNARNKSVIKMTRKGNPMKQIGHVENNNKFRNNQVHNKYRQRNSQRYLGNYRGIHANQTQAFSDSSNKN